MSAKPWSKEDDQYIKDNWDLRRACDISIYLNRQPSDVSTRAIHILGLKPKKSIVNKGTAHSYSYIESFTERPKTSEEVRELRRPLLARPSWFNEPGFEGKLTRGR